jgi:putative endonuclease
MVASQTRVLYIGVTNDIVRRVDAHRQGKVPGFTQRYRVRRLVYYEQTESSRSAIAREKQLKRWRRSKKIALIESTNRAWEDLWESTDVLALRSTSS